MEKAFNLLVIIIALLLVNKASSQDVQLGARGGLNLTTFVGQDVANANLKAGSHLGPYVRVGIRKQLFFQSELLYSTKGYRNEFIINNVPHTFKASLYYLDIPLLLNFEPSPGHIFNIGLQPSILIRDKLKEKTPNLTIVVTDIDIYNRLDLGLVFGYAYEFESGLNVGSRFIYGIPNVVKNNVEENINDVHNVTLQLSVGYTFGFTKQ